MEDLIIECLKIYGFDLYYMPRQQVNRDMILGEDPLNNFKYAYPIEMYLETVQGFGGADLMSKFGVELNDTATFVMARRRWDELINRKGKGVLTTRPAEGDLLYFPATHTFFEIRVVEGTDPFFQVGKLYVYKLQCEIYQFSHEEISTGVQEIDNNYASVDNSILTWELLTEAGGSLLLENDFRSSIINEAYHTNEVDRAAENEEFDAEAESVLSFDESNPFGEVYNR